MVTLTEAEEIHQIIRKNKQLLVIVLVTLILIILYLSILAYGGYMVYKFLPTITTTVSGVVTKFEEAMTHLSSMPTLPTV